VRAIAAFDFDGTLTRRDTMYPFLRELVGFRSLAGAALVDLPRLALTALGRGDRDAAKARLLTRSLAGLDAETVERLGRSHAHRILDHELRPQVIDRVRWHKAHDHETVIVSASLHPYLEPVARALSFDHLLCTRLEIRDGHLTGEMEGGNCRGPAKLARLRDAFGDPATTPYELWAYGDSAGDDTMLHAADHAFRVDRRGVMRAGQRSARR